MSLTEEVVEFAKARNLILGERVRLKKLASAPDAIANTPSWNEHLEGGTVLDLLSGTMLDANAGQSLPVDYEVEGYLLTPLEEGQAIQVLRTKRNGVEKLGILTTSMVKDIDSDAHEAGLLTTENSVYTLEFLD